MKLKKLYLFLSILVLPLVFSACATSERGGTKHTIMLGGLYEYSEASYKPVPKTTLAVRRAEYDPNAPSSGNHASILWGLFTYYDY